MSLVAALFAGLAVIAILFAAWPVLQGPAGSRLRRMVLASAIALAVAGLGLGTYLILGRPELAARSLNPNAQDLNALIAKLATRMRENPEDARGWALLGRAYLTADDPEEAARAFSEGVAAAKLHGNPSSDLLSAYGEALVDSNDGAVTPEAEAAFDQVLAQNPGDQAARYYLGLAYATRGQTGRAAALWQSLLADLPETSPLHGELVDRLAALSARQGTAPDIGTMVAGLAARLKTRPDDPAGWQRLIRAYAVLGQKDKAKRALADARAALAGNPGAQADLETEASDLKIPQ